MKACSERVRASVAAAAAAVAEAAVNVVVVVAVDEKWMTKSFVRVVVVVSVVVSARGKVTADFHPDHQHHQNQSSAQ